MIRAAARAYCRLARSSGEAGFTLLEMIVAVAVLAALVGVIPRSFVAARAAIDRSEAWLKARLVAEAVLNQELVGTTLKPGVFRGDVDGYPWTVTIQANRTLGGPPTETGRVLLDVLVQVPVTASMNLEVETMRIGVAQ
jgi:prepilin-type N-terminal cleavage/methylation domain-containing protein